jgi:hypothetical protein
MIVQMENGEVAMIALNPHFLVSTVPFGETQAPLLRLGHPIHGFLDFLFTPENAGRLVAEMNMHAAQMTGVHSAIGRITAVLDNIDYTTLTPAEIAEKVIAAILSPES